MKSFEIINYGNCGSDQCCAYEIEVSPNVTVKDVVKDIISNKHERGNIIVILTYINHKDEYKIKYDNGKIEDLNEYQKGIWHILQFFTVKSMRGYGGWGSSNYWLEIEY